MPMSRGRFFRGGSRRFVRNRRQPVRARRVQRDDSKDYSFLNDVSIVIYKEFLNEASNGSKYILYNVFSKDRDADDDRGPLYYGFVFDNTRSQIVYLMAMLADRLGYEKLDSHGGLAQLSDEALFNECCDLIEEAIGDSDSIELIGSVVVRQQDNGYKRVYLCKVRGLESEIDAIVKGVDREGEGNDSNRSENRKQSQVVPARKVRVINQGRPKPSPVAAKPAERNESADNVADESAGQDDSGDSVEI